jgi:ATP-dependent RNA helicase SUPV3L1/SUV3
LCAWLAERATDCGDNTRLPNQTRLVAIATVNSAQTNSSSAKSADTQALDALTGGVFSAATSGDRAARVREWLATDPSPERMAEVFKELSHRDKGAAKPLREKLEELRRAKAQETMAVEWADKANALLALPRLNMADALAWQRDAAKAGAPLSREPLAGLKTALAERVKAIEDLQHRVQVEREAAVLLAQRIEVLSTKSWRDAQATAEVLGADVVNWQNQATGLSGDAHWSSMDPKFSPMLDAARQQLTLVWEAFQGALAQAVAAAADAQTPLPAVPVWAEELRIARGESAPEARPTAAPVDNAAAQARRTEAADAVGVALKVLVKELAEGHGKATPKAAADLRAALKQHGRHVGGELEGQVYAALTQAGELEGWQRWRADQLREELLAKAEALTAAPEGQRLGGRKMQETLRQLREQWKATDQGGVPNHGLWKKFDDACTRAHKLVEAWLDKVREQAEQHKAQRQALLAEVRAWTEAHAESSDWKSQIRELHQLAERWREAGHLSEKQFAELQPQWKDAMHQAHARLEAAQAESLARRRAMIDEATALGAAPMLRIDAVKALQQRWQAEAQAVPLDRKQEQKLWEAFRQPIDEAFNRKGADREKAAQAVSEHDRHVLDAAKALEAANQSGDAQQIRAAVAALEAALRGQAQAQAAVPAAPVEAPAPAAVEAAALAAGDEPAEPAAAEGDASADAAVDAPEVSAEAPAPAPAPVAPPKKVVAVRGDDRPGMKKAEPAGNDRGRPGDRDRKPGGRDGGRPGGDRGPRGDARGDFRMGERPMREERGPRLGDAAFRAQREALERADMALRKLAAQAHGEVLSRVMTAWEKRDAEALPSVQELGGRVAAPVRGAWAQALSAGTAKDEQAATALLRLEIAADVPTPADQISARRMYQLQLLTKRNEAAPTQTWGQDTAQVLASGFDAGAARRLQNALKALLKKA